MRRESFRARKKIIATTDESFYPCILLLLLVIGCSLNTSSYSSQKSRRDSTQERLQTKIHTLTPFSQFLLPLCLLFTTSFTTIECLRSPVTYLETFNHEKYDSLAVISRKHNFFMSYKPNQFSIHGSSDRIFSLPKINSPNSSTTHVISEFAVLQLLHISTISSFHKTVHKPSAFLSPFSIHLQTFRNRFHHMCTSFCRVTGIFKPSIITFNNTLSSSHPIPPTCFPSALTMELQHETQMQCVQLNLEQLDFHQGPASGR